MCDEFQIIAFLVWAVIAASLAFIMFILSVIGAIVGVPWKYTYTVSNELLNSQH